MTTAYVEILPPVGAVKITFIPGPWLVLKNEEDGYVVETRHCHNGAITTADAELKGKRPPQANAQLIATAPSH